MNNRSPIIIKIQKIEHFIFKNNTDFEHRLLLLTSGIISIVAFINTIIDIFLDFDMINIAVSFIGFIIFSLLFHIGYIHKQFKLVKWLLVVFSSLFINIIWAFNFNSYGPSLLFFLIFICFILLIFNRKEIIILAPLLIMNIIALLIIELYEPSWLAGYATNRLRIIDIYIGTLVAIIILATYTAAAKTNYIKQYQKAKQSDDLKTAFIANMSHEIRTPLNAIVGFSELIVSSRIDDAKRKDYISLIKSNNKYLLGLISDILDIAKIESKQLNLRFHKFRIDPVFKKVHYELSKEIDLKGKEIDAKYIEGDEELSIISDRIRFEQVLRSLLSNAIKFTSSGQIRLGFEEGKDWVYFFIEDTGSGINKKYLESIFERFTKINDSDTMLYRGTGVGLYLVKNILMMLGGNIKVESQVGKGTRFTFWLPKEIPNGHTPENNIEL